MNITDNIFNTLQKDKQWALAGAAVGGLGGATGTLLSNLFSKDKNVKWYANILRNTLLGAASGAGLGYGSNKAFSRYIAHSLMKDPVGYSDYQSAHGDKPSTTSLKASLLIPEGWDVLTNKNSTKQQRLSALKQVLKHVYKNTTTPIDLDIVNKQKHKHRSELLARNLGVFDESKGSLFRKLTKQEREQFKKEENILFPRLDKKYKDIYMPKEISPEGFASAIPRLYNESSFETPNPLDASMYDPDRKFLDTSMGHNIMGGYTAVKPKIDSDSIYFHDIWDYALHKNEKEIMDRLIKQLSAKHKDKTGLSNIISSIATVVNTPKITKGYQKDKKNEWTAFDNVDLLTLMSRKAFEKLFEHPIAIYGKEKIPQEDIEAIKDKLK